MISPRILIVDDNAEIRTQVSRWLLRDNYLIDEAASQKEALSKISKNDYSVVLLDLKLQNGIEEGFHLLQKLNQEYPDTCVIIMTAYGSSDYFKRARREGAFDFLDKPLRFNILQPRIESAIEHFNLAREREYHEEVRREEHSFKNIIGDSPKLKQVMERAKKVAASDASVLIQGETGTGKEMIAYAIHYNSPRSKQPFIIADCSTINPNLIESYLFGHERGSFTGATSRRKGTIERADRGTLFIDEIGELTNELQMKLLRFLQEGTFERVGGEGASKVDVRVIAATKVDLKQAIQQGKFRDDLYFRFQSIINIPPLRDRKEDIPLLVDHFVAKYARKNSRNEMKVSLAAMTSLINHDFRGNIRELENIIQDAIISTEGDEIKREVLRLESMNAEEVINEEIYKLPIKEATHQFERKYILRLLERNNWNITNSAKEAKIDRSNLTLKMKKYGIQKGR